MIKRIIALTLIITTTTPTIFYGMIAPDSVWDLFGVIYGFDKKAANSHYKSEEWSPFTSPDTSPQRPISPHSSGAASKSTRRYSRSYRADGCSRTELLWQLTGHVNVHEDISAKNSPHFDIERLLECDVWPVSEVSQMQPKEIAWAYANTRKELSKDEKDRLVDTSSAFIENIADFVHPIKSGMRIFQLLKEKGSRTFILSNIPQDCNVGMHKREFLERCMEEIPNYIDPFSTSIGEFYSIDKKLRKPDLRIYRDLLEHSGISAYRIFIDDSLKNLRAAAEAGIFSISCATHAELYLTLLTLGLIERDGIEESLLNNDEELSILRTLQYGANTKSFDFYINALLLTLFQDENETFDENETYDENKAEAASLALGQALDRFDCATILGKLAIVFGHPTTYGDPTHYMWRETLEAKQLHEKFRQQTA